MLKKFPTVYASLGSSLPNEPKFPFSQRLHSTHCDKIPIFVPETKKIRRIITKTMNFNFRAKTNKKSIQMFGIFGQKFEFCDSV